MLDNTFQYQYVPTHANAIPYIVGLILGTLFVLVKDHDWQPSKVSRESPKPTVYSQTSIETKDTDF